MKSSFIKACNLLKSIKPAIKAKIPSKSTYFSSDVITHSQMVNEIFEWTTKCARIIGAGIFDNDYKVTNKIIKFFISLTIFNCIINLVDIYQFRNDTVRCVFCLLTFSAIIQGFVKVYTFLWLRENIFSLRKKTEKFHEHFTSLKSSESFEEQFMIVAHVCVGLTVLYISTLIAVAVYPIIFYFIMNERILHFGIELPFIDWENSWIGYGINFFHQLMCVGPFFCASIASLCVIICFMTSAIGQFDVLKILLDELNGLAIGNEDEKRNDEICKKLKFLAHTHANLIEYMQELKRTFAPYYFFEFAALVFQKTVELFAIISLNFIPGYLCAFVTGFQLFLPCAIGSILKSKGDQFYNELYCVSWNLMPTSDQKSLKFMLLYSKTSKGLAAGIINLNFSTFLEIYRAIYSYLMLLQSFK